MGGASAGVPVTPLPRGLPEIRDWPLDVLRGAFEASTLPITTVEALGELLGDITPSWASAPVLALLASRGAEAPLSAASWTRVSSRTGGGTAAVDLPVPAGAGASPVVDADAAGDDDPTQPYVNVDGVDPTVSDPWRLLEPCAGATTGATPAAGGDAVPRGARDPVGESPSDPTGVSREIKFGGTSIYEFDAESPIGERVEDSPTPLAIPCPAGSDLGGGSGPADRRTSHAVDNRLAPSDGGCALVAAHRAAQSGFPPPISNAPGVLAGGFAGGSHAGPALATPQPPAPVRGGVHVSLGDGTGLLYPPGTTAGEPRRGGVPDVSPGERWCPESLGAGSRPPMDAGRRPPQWESRLQDLERDLEDAQATCQALSSEQDRRLQELQRVRADLHRSEGELASMRRDHATVSGELVRQRSRTRSLEEEGSGLRRQLADAQRAARDVAGAVDERLSRHLPAILEAVQIVRDEHISQPAVERALWGWVPAGYGPPSTANPNFREICATLVCAAVLRVDPAPSLEQLSRRLRVPVQPVLHFPTEAVGQGPLLGMSADTRPMGRAPAPHEGPETSPVVRSAGKPGVEVTPGNRSGGDITPTTTGAAGAAAPTPGRDELRALLVYLNEVPPDSQTGEAQKLHLHLATRLDLPPGVPPKQPAGPLHRPGQAPAHAARVGPPGWRVRPGPPGGALRVSDPGP